MDYRAIWLTRLSNNLKYMIMSANFEKWIAGMTNGLDIKDFNNDWRNKDPYADVGRWLFRACRVFLWPLRHPHRTVKAVEPWSILFAVIGLLVSLWALQIDRMERAEDRANRERDLVDRAWSRIIDTYPENSKRGGLASALELLVRLGERARGIELPNADLSGADLSDAELDDANFRGADLTSITLHRARLQGADLRGTNLRKADLTKAYVSEADLAGADLEFANFGGALLPNAKLPDVTLYGADFSHALLSGTDFTGARIHGSDFTRAILIGTNGLPSGLLDSTFCWTTMPDGFNCNRDCPGTRDKSCPYLDE